MSMSDWRRASILTRTGWAT